jgi:hypothetical protein
MVFARAVHNHIENHPASQCDDQGEHPVADQLVSTCIARMQTYQTRFEKNAHSGLESPDFLAFSRYIRMAANAYLAEVWHMENENGGVWCDRCRRMTEHRHMHDCAHGIPETHMAGSERYRCEVCGNGVYKAEGEILGLRFTLD